MRNVITQFPVLISAVFVLITGVVFAQVLPEEPAVETPEVLVESSELIIAEPEISSSTQEVLEGDVTASSTEDIQNIEIPSSSLTEPVLEESTSIALETEELLSEESIKNTLFEESEEVYSLNDLERPQQCQTDGAKKFFDTFGECVRYVTAKISDSKREPFEDKLSEQPEGTLE